MNLSFYFYRIVLVAMGIILLFYYINCILASFVKSFEFDTNLFAIEKNKKLNGIPIETKSNVILQRCIMLCKLNSNCHSINFGENGGHCELLNQTTKTHKDDLYDVDRWMHYETHPANCQIRLICLKKSPCQNGKCIDQCESPGYRCICDSGYCGDNCEFFGDISGCSSCVHGDCVRCGNSNYKCVCKTFASGKSCDNIFFEAPQFPTILPYMNMSKPFEWSAEIRTTLLRAIIVANAWLPTPLDARPCAIWKNEYPSQGKGLFIFRGGLKFHIGWVGSRLFGVVISDGNWHSIGFRYENGSYELTVDNVRSSGLWTRDIVTDHPDHVTVLGYDVSGTLCQSGFAPQFEGEIRNLKYKPL